MSREPHVTRNPFQLILFYQTDPSVNLSTVAPIAITIIDVRNDKQYFLARATCTYDRVRGKIRVSRRNRLFQLLTDTEELYQLLIGW